MHPCTSEVESIYNVFPADDDESKFYLQLQVSCTECGRGNYWISLPPVAVAVVKQHHHHRRRRLLRRAVRTLTHAVLITNFRCIISVRCRLVAGESRCIITKLHYDSSSCSLSLSVVHAASVTLSPVEGAVMRALQCIQSDLISLFVICDSPA